MPPSWWGGGWYDLPRNPTPALGLWPLGLRTPWRILGSLWWEWRQNLTNSSTSAAHNSGIPSWAGWIPNVNHSSNRDVGEAFWIDVLALYNMRRVYRVARNSDANQFAWFFADVSADVGSWSRKYLLYFRRLCYVNWHHLSNLHVLYVLFEHNNNNNNNNATI